MVLKLTEGRTYPIDADLQAAGLPFDLTGSTVALILKKCDGFQITTTGNTAVVSNAGGRVRYTPDAGDLLAKFSPYLARWRVTTPTGIVYFPEGPEDKWEVYAP